MSIEAKLVTLLQNNSDVAALVVDRIYPDILPQSPTYPAITYAELMAGDINTLSGSSDLLNPHMQIDCWATTRLGAKGLANKVKTAIEGGTTIKGFRTSGRSMYEDDVKIYRYSADYSLWGKEA